MNRMFALPLATLVAASALAVGFALPASAAGSPTRIDFVGETEITAPFNSPWELPIRVRSDAENGKINIKGSDGTVDIFVEGVPGEYVTAATIYPGGMTYFTQPANEPPLGAGEYTVTAVFTPAAGSELGTSKTTKSATLTITPLAITPSAVLLTDPAEVAVPTVRTSLAGEYLDTVGAPPSGTWTVTGVDSNGDDAFAVTAEQPTEATEGVVGPLDIPITDALKPGETYTISSEFEADPLIEPGLEYENPAAVDYTTTPLTTAEVLSTPVAVPIWVTILNGLLLIGLVVLLVWLIGAWSRGRTRTVDDAALATGPSALPATPSPAALGAAPAAPVAPASTSWSLTDDAPADDPKQG